MTSKAITVMIDAARGLLTTARKAQQDEVCEALSWEATHLAMRAYRFASPDDADHLPGLRISDEDVMAIADLCGEAERLRESVKGAT